jgi:hypothetical protein
MPARNPAKPTTPVKKPATRGLLQKENKNFVDRFANSAISLNDAQSRVANAASSIFAKANSRFAHVTRHLLKEGDMNAAADKVARAQYDLNAENTARFGGRQLLKEGDMNAAAEKVARAQYDLNSDNIARYG